MALTDSREISALCIRIESLRAQLLEHRLNESAVWDVFRDVERLVERAADSRLESELQFISSVLAIVWKVEHERRAIHDAMPQD